jgi:hypothetical protein
MNQAPVNNPGNASTQTPGVEVVIPMNSTSLNLSLCYLILTRAGQQALLNASAKAVELRKKQNASKKQAKKASSKMTTKTPDGKSSVSSGSESDTSGSELEIEMPEEASPIPYTRPNEPVAAVQYDALQAVWSPRNRRPNVDKVKSALVAFKDVVKTVRDTWKEKSQAMKMAENKGENDKAAQIKKDVVLQRRLMHVVVSTTLDQGHPMIVEKYVLSLFFSYPLMNLNLAYRCHGHRSQKRIESLSRVIYLVWFPACLKRMLINKGRFYLAL